MLRAGSGPSGGGPGKVLTADQQDAYAPVTEVLRSEKNGAEGGIRVMLREGSGRWPWWGAGAAPGRAGEVRRLERVVGAGGVSGLY